MVQNKKMQVFCGESSSPKKISFLKKKKYFATLAHWTAVRKMRHIGQVWRDLMSFSFFQHHRHSQQLRKDRSKITPQGKKITKYIFLQNFYFYTCPEIGFKRVREFFADSQNSGMSLEVWHFVIRIGQDSNFGILPPELGKTPILAFCHQNWAKTPSRSKTAN